MTETPILDERAVSEIEAQINSGSLILPLRVEHWHMSLTSGGWYIKNASDRIVMTVAFVPVEIETGKPALDGNAPARHTAALLNSIPALCATVKHLLDREKKYAKVLSDRLREMESLGTAFDELHEQHSDLQSQLEQLRAENVSLTKSLRDAYDFYMGPQACGDFTCTCDQPKLCGICEIREATELTLADDLLATTPVVNCNPPG